MLNRVSEVFIQLYFLICFNFKEEFLEQSQKTLMMNISGIIER